MCVCVCHDMSTRSGLLRSIDITLLNYLSLCVVNTEGGSRGLLARLKLYKQFVLVQVFVQLVPQ